MKTKFTPGPWLFEYGSVYAGDTRIAMADRGEDKTMPTERDNNCRLIAAAPELYEALEALLMNSCAPLGHSKLDRYGEACDKARKALAKARGE